MEKLAKENFDIKRGLKIAAKTLVDCFIGIMFAFSIVFVIFPKLSLKINNLLGATKIQEYNYQMIYAKSDNITDLYNLIIFEGEQENTEKELKYIDEMIARDDYNEFCEAMDKANLKKTDNKSLLRYSTNVSGYIYSRKINCMYSLGTQNIESYIFKLAGYEKVTGYGFSSYVELVYNDKNLTKSQKLEKFTYLNELMNEKGKTMKNLLDEKISSLKNFKIRAESDNEKLVYNYTLSRIYSANYYFYDILSNDGKNEEYKNLKEENLENYNSIREELNA